MHSEKYKTQILFNGEIYNHSELREELEAEGLKFSTSHSDTEVILLGLSHHGLDFIDKIVGQFAIVFIDEEKQTINLIRDRLGQKPLFYRFTEDSFIFSSNLKSIVLLENNYNIDNDSLIEYFGFHPDNLIFFVSKKIKGLSPTHPLFPPLKIILGFNFKTWQILCIDFLTFIYSFVPRFIIFIFLSKYFMPS